MYRLSSTNSWFNGMRFDSLAEAKAKCDKCDPSVAVCDVIALVDRDHWRAVYSNRGDITTGTYRK